MTGMCRLHLIMLLWIAGCGAAFAQPSFVLTRGPELERLDALVGRWEGQLTRTLPGGDQITLRPVVEFAWDVGGVWLAGRERTELPNGDVIENMIWMTWHPREGRYHGAWHDNVYPSFVAFTATWDDDGALVLDSGPAPVNGRAHRIVQKYEFNGADEFRTAMRQSWDDGPLHLVATATYERLERDGDTSS